MPRRVEPNRNPPKTAVKFASTVRAGSARSRPMNRWTTRNRTGLMAMVSSARISSETFMVPIRAVKAAPTLPEMMTPVMSGPISRKMATATNPGI